jgi:hypothetical protein
VVNLKRVKTEVESKIYRTSEGISAPRKRDFRIQVRPGEKKIINATYQQE